MKTKYHTYSTITATVFNILLAYAVYMLCRVAYVCENWSTFATGWPSLSGWALLRCGIRYDGAAIAYTNFIYAFLMLLPVIAKERQWWQTMTKWIFVVVNSVAVVINLCDAVYSQYTGRRTTCTFFHEFSNEGNLGSIFFTETLRHFYLVILFAVVMWGVYKLYQETRLERKSLCWWRYDLACLLSLLALILPK